MKMKAKANSKASPGNAMPKPVAKTGKNRKGISRLSTVKPPRRVR